MDLRRLRVRAGDGVVSRTGTVANAADGRGGTRGGNFSARRQKNAQQSINSRKRQNPSIRPTTTVGRTDQAENGRSCETALMLLPSLAATGIDVPMSHGHQGSCA
jgi:hypothetical protein